MAAQPPLPVICDRCAARGHAGGDLFARFGDLLDFEPVPRKKQRADGWTPEVQRHFIAALALTGSERQAAHAVGKAAFGVTQLKNAPGNEGFMAAHAKAMAFFEAEQGRRLADGLLAAAHHAAHRHTPGPPWSGAATRQQPLLPAPEQAADGELSADERESLEMLAGIVSKLSFKLCAEREARIEGRIAEADFYLRQITWLEVALDLASGGGSEAWRELRHDGHHPIDIAETPMSRLLDLFRREHWEACGDPPRPEHPLHHLLVKHSSGYSTEPGEGIWGGPPEYRAAQQRAYDERHAEDARAQIAWEAEARRDYERRRAAAPPIGKEPGSAGQPAR